MIVAAAIAVAAVVGGGGNGGGYLRELAVSLIPSINVSWGGESSMYPEQILACPALEQHSAR